MSRNESSSLHERKGVTQPETTSASSAQKVKLSRGKKVETSQLVEGILAGDISSLSRAITLVESTNPNHQQKANKILEQCLNHSKNAIRIGITGVPGVGKSTFIEAFGKHLTGLGKKVAVLAVDPSSSINKGSILGDKTRMEELVTDPNAFIRPSPSGTSLGGVARKTKEIILLCEAAGYDTIIIETVGVGQSETVVHSMVDFFLLLKLAGAGDELQGMKRGIIEMADAIVINKADGDNTKAAKMAKVEFTRALHLYPPKDNQWSPEVLLASALNNIGIDKVHEMVNRYIELTQTNGYFQQRRNEQNKQWLFSTIDNALKDNFFQMEKIQNALQVELEKLDQGKSTPFQAAQKLLSLYNER